MKTTKIDKNNKLLKQEIENQRKYASTGGTQSCFPWSIQRQNPNVIFTPSKRGNKNKKRY